MRTDDSLAHGTVRLAPMVTPSGCNAALVAWNGGGLLIPERSSGELRMHKIPFITSPGPYWFDAKDCTIEGVPHQSMPIDVVYFVYAKADENDEISLDSSTTGTNVFNGLVTKNDDPFQICVGCLAVLPYGGNLGFPGGPTCGMVSSFFQPELMALTTVVGGECEPFADWTEVVPYQTQLHFTCFGDGREPVMYFSGALSNSVSGGQTFAAISVNGGAVNFAGAGGGYVPLAGSGVSATMIRPGAGFGQETPPIPYHIGLKMYSTRGRGSIPWTGTLTAHVLM